jgi:hypothetical protein
MFAPGVFIIAAQQRAALKAERIDVAIIAEEQSCCRRDSRIAAVFRPAPPFRVNDSESIKFIH